MRHRVNLIVKCRHGLSPFSEKFNDQDDVLMTINQRGITSHDVNFPLAEGTNYDIGFNDVGRVLDFGAKR